MGIELEKQERKDIQLDISNTFLDTKSLKFPLLKIIYNDCDIKINSRFCHEGTKEDSMKDLKDILSKGSSFKCSLCSKDISTFEFFIKKESQDMIICNDCYIKLKEKNEDEQYLSLEEHISTCDKHGEKYEFFCVNCNRNLCSKCKEVHTELSSKHELIAFEDILEEKEIDKKVNLSKKVKNLSQMLKNVSNIKLLELDEKIGKRYNNISERFSRENKFAEIIISTFNYFLNKKTLCYEIISNFNELTFNKELNKIDIKSIFDYANNFLEHTFHIINQSPDVTEIKKRIIPLSERNIINSKDNLSSEIRGIIELKDGSYLVGSMDGNIGIYGPTDLELKQKFRLDGITNIYHMEKIKDEDLDLIGIASNLNEIIIISIFKKENASNETNEDIFYYKFELRKQEHNGKINRIIQLSNGLIVSSSEDNFVIFWKLIKNENNISLECISKIEMDKNVYMLIEIPYSNELLCNNVLLDLETFTKKRELKIHLEGSNFNLCVCLFKEKYISYLDLCFGVAIMNIETGEKYYVEGRYDYVDAIYTVDNETFCLCTKDLHDIFGICGGMGLTQQYKLDENDFVEIGSIIPTGVCNCYMTDSKNNFIMGTMGGKIVKFTLK